MYTSYKNDVDTNIRRASKIIICNRNIILWKGTKTMDTFNIIAGIASIISLIVGIISLVMVKKTKDIVSTFTNSNKNKISSSNSGQNIQADNTRGSITMAGRDVKG